MYLGGHLAAAIQPNAGRLPEVVDVDVDLVVIVPGVERGGGADHEWLRIVLAAVPRRETIPAMGCPLHNNHGDLAITREGWTCI